MPVELAHLTFGKKSSPEELGDARLGYTNINSHGRAFVSGEQFPKEISYAAKMSWGEDWRKCLEDVRNRAAQTFREVTDSCATIAGSQLTRGAIGGV